MAPKSSLIGLKRVRPWSPRRAIAPRTRRDGDDLVVTGNGSAGCYGGWDLTYPAPKAGEWVRFRVKARWDALERGFDCVNVAVTWLNRDGQQVGWEPVFPARVTKEYVLYEGRIRVSEGAKVMVARLFLAWSALGEIRWSDPQLVRAAPPRPRRMRLGAAGARLPGERSIRANTRFFLDLCEHAAKDRIDLLCLPEIMLQWGMSGIERRLSSMAVTVPGKEIEPFQNLARLRRMALCFSVLEKNGEMVHNTAILIDKKGRLVGKYRKVHLAQPFEVWWGVTPGHEFPVYRVGKAMVGMNICMDSSAAESARVPARRGAEIVCLPIMGDHRASSCLAGTRRHEFDLNRWQMIQCMRAVDNQVYMVVARNVGIGSGIFSPRGEVLALSGGGRVVWADVDLSDLPRTNLDSTYRGVCWCERREPVYADLAGGLLPDPFADRRPG